VSGGPVRSTGQIALAGVFWTPFFGSCVAPAGPQRVGGSPFAELRRQTVAAVPVVATRPLSSPRDPVVPLLSIGTTIVLGPAAGAAVGVSGGLSNGSRRNDRDLLEGIADPSPYVSSRLQATFAHHLGARFVPVKEGDYRRSSDGLTQIAAAGTPRFSLSVASRGFGLRPVKGSPEDRAVFYRGDVTVADWAVPGGQAVMREECRLESLMVLSIAQLQRTSGKVWLQDRLNHLATRCARIVEEEICHHERPSDPLDRCVTIPDEADEAEDVGDF
jgi:hypothetical protein